MGRLSFRVVAVSFIAFGLTIYAQAQGGATGAITGTVQDPSGAFVANAQVRITNQDTSVLERTVQTEPDGSFTAPLLPVGTYTVTVKSAGFAERTFPDVVV